MAAWLRLPFFDHVAGGSGRVVERYGADFLILGEKLPALVERHRMRQHLTDLCQLRPWHREQLMFDPQAEFGVHVEVMFQQQVVVHHYRAGQRVLDRNERGVNACLPAARQKPRWK